MIPSAVLDALLAAGATAEMIVAAVKADAAEQEAKLTDKRAKDAERQRKSRASRNVTVTACDTADATPSPSSSPDPSNNPTPVHTHGDRASASRPWPCPEGVEPRHWSDFLANRKRKRLTNSDTAREGVMNDLANLADNDWPPGRLVQLAAAKGWGSINYPSDGPRNAPRNPTHGRSLSGDGLGPTARAALRVIGGG